MRTFHYSGLWLHPKDDERLARRDELDNLLTRMEEKLNEREYQKEVGRRDLCFRNIRSIYQRTLLTKK